MTGTAETACEALSRRLCGTQGGGSMQVEAVSLQRKAHSPMLMEEPGGRVKDDSNVEFFLHFVLWKLPDTLRVINS